MNFFKLESKPIEPQLAEVEIYGTKYRVSKFGHSLFIAVSRLWDDGMEGLSVNFGDLGKAFSVFSHFEDGTFSASEQTLGRTGGAVFHAKGNSENATGILGLSESGTKIEVVMNVFQANFNVTPIERE